ncbi:transketolase family protein [Sporomusa sp.]|uniref:transketolase family protein n=1 Tax=Sporomusa sp. TaxID=2078658 RepID=UPI0032C221EF
MEANRIAYGKALAELGKVNDKIVVLDADLGKATNTIKFKDVAPDRYLDCGIAEQNMIGIAAGLATTGKIAFASTFAVFASLRALEQVRNSICYPNLNVKVVATHAGIETGGDGASHQAIEDIATMRCLPNMKVLVPSDHISTNKLVKVLSEEYGPMYMRVGRDANEALYAADEQFFIGGSKELVSGDYATVIACGTMVYQAREAASKLAAEGINIRVIDMYSIKPLDEAAIIKAAKETKGIVTIEDHNIIGGLGSAVCEVVSFAAPTKVIRLGVQDKFGRSGSANELFQFYGLTADAIMDAVKTL